MTQLDAEIRALKQQALQACWWMRGGLTYDQALEMSKEEFEIISGIIKENLETTKKTKMPFF